MVVLGESARPAATAVGQVSTSHFSRDYSAAYGRRRQRTRLECGCV